MTERTQPIIETRAEAESFLDDRIGLGVQPGLERISGLLGFMGQPQESVPTIHVAGTNGKTTVSRMVQQILGAHGLATGGFTSPHLETVEERFTLSGQPLTSEEFTQAVRDIAWFVAGYETESGTSVTYFEVTAALAFSVFATAAIDVGVIEVGLGGRLDATNVVDAAVSVITGIDIDHTEFLGDTIGAIAAEKAAILKDNGVVVTGSLPPDAEKAVADRVATTDSNWIRRGADFDVTDAIPAVGGFQCSIRGVYADYEDLFLPIHGAHQVDNLASAIAACEMFLGRALDPELVLVAVASIRAPGRLEVVDRMPLVLLDGSHNPQGFHGLASTLDAEFPAMPWSLVLAVRGNRKVADLLEPLVGLIGSVFATRVDDPTSLEPDEVADAAATTLGVPAVAVRDPVSAVAAAKEAAGPNGGVVVAGSLYLVGDLRSQFRPPPETAQETHLRFEAERNDEDEWGVDEDEEDHYSG